jgi:hypothetical protein
LSNVVAIAAGNYHDLALKSDGTVVAWGRNDDGQTNVPAGLSRVVAIAAGWYHSLALKSDGTIVAWGRNDDGQTNVPEGLSGVVAVAAGGTHNLALVALPPVLRSEIVGTNIVLSWPSSAQGFTLQSTTILADPDSWTTLTNVPVIMDQRYTVTNAISGAIRFYRLKQ